MISGRSRVNISGAKCNSRAESDCQLRVFDEIEYGVVGDHSQTSEGIHPVPGRGAVLSASPAWFPRCHDTFQLCGHELGLILVRVLSIKGRRSNSGITVSSSSAPRQVRAKCSTTPKTHADDGEDGKQGSVELSLLRHRKWKNSDQTSRRVFGESAFPSLTAH